MHAQRGSSRGLFFPPADGPAHPTAAHVEDDRELSRSRRYQRQCRLLEARVSSLVEETTQLRVELQNAYRAIEWDRAHMEKMRKGEI